ncbi:Chromator [Carabus blaptoides fortunei]
MHCGYTCVLSESVAAVAVIMDGDIIDPLEINKHPKIIKEAQSELGKLDIIVCGQCHTVFHFVEQFQDHRLMGNCSGISSIRENNINESKAQVWAFLLWKGSQHHEEGDNSWVVYQRWCKMDAQIKDAWIVAGRNVQVFTKLSAAKMQEVRAKAQVTRPKQIIDDDPLEEGEIKDPLADSEEPSDMDSELDTEEEAEKEELEKMKNNNGTASADNGAKGQDTDEKEDLAKKIQINSAAVNKPQGVPIAVDKSSRAAIRTDKINATENECTVEKILAKRFNPRRKLHEYLIKWDGCPHEQNTWEPPVHLDTCRHLMDAFERNLARQKEAKAAAQAALLKQQQQKPAGKQQAGPSGMMTTSAGRPQRTSKQKALDQVKQWCGNISDRDDELGLKRKADSDSDDDLGDKKIKMELDSGSEDEWQADEAEIERHTSVGRPRVFQKSTSVLNGLAKKQMTANEVARSIGLASPDRPTSPPMLLTTTNSKNIVKVYKNQMPNLASGVYIMSKKDGIVKLESTPNLIATTNPNIIRVQKNNATGQSPATSAGNNLIRLAPPKIGQTQVRVVAKSGADSNAVRLSPGMSRASIGAGLVPKIKTTIKPAIRVTPKERLQAHRMQIGTPQLKVVKSGIASRHSALKQVQTQVQVQVQQQQQQQQQPQPQQQQQFAENPDDPEKETESSDDDFDPFPKDLPPPEPDSPPREFTLDPMTGLILGQAEGEPDQVPVEQHAVEAAQPEEEEQKLKGEDEQQDSEQSGSQDMPSLLLSDSSNVATTLSETTTTITLPETGEPLMITGEDGVVYQVAGQNEEGQTLLVAQGVDGQQQCVYVTTTAEDGQNDVDGTVLTLDSAVAEAMGGAEGTVVTANEGVTEMEPLTVETGGLEDQGDGDDANSQVVAQLVKAELPSPGGTRKVVLLLPDGNLLMTEVDAEQYAALELDK